MSDFEGIDDLRRLAEEYYVPCRLRDLQKIKIAKDTQAYLDAGGVITKIDDGYSGVVGSKGEMVHGTSWLKSIK